MKININFMKQRREKPLYFNEFNYLPSYVPIYNDTAIRSLRISLKNSGVCLHFFGGRVKDLPVLDEESRTLTIWVKKEDVRLSRFDYAIVLKERPLDRDPLDDSHFWVELSYSLGDMEYEFRGHTEIKNPKKKLKFLLDQMKGA